MELQKGRPKDTAGRLEKEIRTYDLLDKLGVAYERVDHEAAMTMEVCQEIDKVLQATICKNLFPTEAILPNDRLQTLLPAYEHSR